MPSILPPFVFPTTLSNLSPSTIILTIFLLLLLANFKSFPLAWHIRLLSSVFYHTRWRKNAVITAASHGGEALFRSVITSSRSPMYECDISAHKSNSTYFSDLDLNRMQLLAWLFKAAANPELLPKEMGERSLKMRVVLGGTGCIFRREIKPYEPYEIHSRILCWDQKWIYIVSHFVSRKVLRKVGCQRKGMKAGENISVIQKSDSIFASAISKYVFKHGRQTVPPMEALQSLRLLPEIGEKSYDENDGRGNGHWTREQVEAENQKGLKYGRHFQELSSLDTLFDDRNGEGKHVSSCSLHGFQQ